MMKMALSILYLLKEIFYQYNLIAYNGKSGSGTLTRIFDNYAVQGGKELRQSIKDFDDSGSLLSFV